MYLSAKTKDVIKKLLLITSVLSSLLLTAPEAKAHTVLIGSDPAAGSTITQLPEEITLNFAEPLLTLGSKEINQVQVVDPTGSIISTGKNLVKGSTLSNVLAPKSLAPGIFKVTFRVVAQDGHPVTGNFLFTLGKSTPKSTFKPIPHGIYQVVAKATRSGAVNGKSMEVSPATLTMSLNFKDKLICYSIKSAIKNVLAIHVHSINQGNLSISDEIYLPLRSASINALAPICDAALPANMATLFYNINRYVMVIHTKAFPDGAVAGSLRLIGGKK